MYVCVCIVVRAYKRDDSEKMRHRTQKKQCHITSRTQSMKQNSINLPAMPSVVLRLTILPSLSSWIKLGSLFTAESAEAASSSALLREPSNAFWGERWAR